MHFNTSHSVLKTNSIRYIIINRRGTRLRENLKKKYILLWRVRMTVNVILNVAFKFMRVLGMFTATRNNNLII